MDKLKYIAKRLAMAAVTMLLITVVVFIVIQLPPGNFVDTLVAQMISEGERVTQVEIDNLRAMYGVDRPMVLQYLPWLGGILTGDWGTSFYFNQSVLVMIGETLGMAISFVLAVIIGGISGYYGGWVDELSDCQPDAGHPQHDPGRDVDELSGSGHARTGDQLGRPAAGMSERA